MMYVVHKRLPKNRGADGSVVWHIGGVLPSAYLQDLLGDNWLDGVVEVQADGDELTYIHTRFTNIPHTTLTRCPRWFGDMAKFIVANMTR